MFASRQLASRVSRSMMVSKSMVTKTVVPVFQCTRLNSTAAAAPVADIDPKISKIVDEISQLTLLETSTLITELKVKLNIPDISFPVGGVGAGAANGGGADGAGAAKAVVEEEVKEEKTMFTLKLESFDAKAKAKIIKEVKTLLGLSLVEAKKFVEAAPKVLKENLAKEDADKIKTTLETLGAKIVLE